MKTNSIYKTSLLAAALLLAATSCVKDELHDTPHPDYGKITVTADWTDRGDGVDIPAEWTVTMGDYTGTETGETHAPDYLFNPGNYTLAAYNTPENITVSGTTATVAPETGNGTYISNAPGAVCGGCSVAESRHCLRQQPGADADGCVLPARKALWLWRRARTAA